MTERLHNVNVLSSELLPTPEAVKQALPLPTAVEEFVYRSRGALRRILTIPLPPASTRSDCGRLPSA